MRLENARSFGAFAALGLTVAAATVALGTTAPASSNLARETGSTVLVSPADDTPEASLLSALAAERDLASVRAADASELLESIKAARAGAVEQATRAAERARIAAAPPREVGRILAAERGFTGDQWSCLDSLWQRESNWSHTAQNRSSGAYGIPQALPGSKMATVAADWRTNPATQIIWGLNYIVARYGTPCGAWNQSQNYNWY